MRELIGLSDRLHFTSQDLHGFFDLAVVARKEIGGAVVDSSSGAGAIPFAAAIVPVVALLLILSQERGSSVAPALSQPALKEAML